MEGQAMKVKDLAPTIMCKIWVREWAKLGNLRNSPIVVTSPTGEHVFQAWVLGSLGRLTPTVG